MSLLYVSEILHSTGIYVRFEKCLQHEDMRNFYNIDNTTVLVNHSFYEDPTHDDVLSLSNNANLTQRSSIKVGKVLCYDEKIMEIYEILAEKFMRQINGDGENR
ncbi:hypothetical protein H5410_056631 [Solanum commersonii]|uniref:Uncharacterized protein n=1 Tax=Solanum commersonii TaxID=4109 RepID=A0A9J5WKR5_SOLCO|nr:hypothetical protein H5410_056631 [Solanum commersonii]